MTVQVLPSVRQAVPADALVRHYRTLICDLDGVVYRGSTAVPGALETLIAVLSTDVQVCFATNNASRTPEHVHERLVGMGLPAGGWTVVTSAQAAAGILARQLPKGASVLAVGGAGVARALTDVGLVPCESHERVDVAAVVQGAGPDVAWRDLAEVAHQVQRGALWVATNTDATIPTGRGLAPGNGSLVAAVRGAVGVDPYVVGKPGPDLFQMALARMGAASEDVLVIGDRLDTDVAGAKAAGLDSLFVLGGAHRMHDLVHAAEGCRPDHVARDLRGLLRPAAPRGEPAGQRAWVNAWGEVSLRDRRPDGLLSAAVAVAWQARDAGRVLAGAPDTWDALTASIEDVSTEPADVA